MTEKIIKNLHKRYSNCTTITNLNIYKNCYKLDNIKKDVLLFTEYDSIYSMKYYYKKDKRYYFIFIEKIDEKITTKILQDKIDKLYNLWCITKNNTNKYYQKFLRRIKYNILNKLYLFISSNDINNDALEYLNNIYKCANEDYEEKKEFYDFIIIKYQNNIF